MKIVNDTIVTFHRQQVLAKIIADNLKTTIIKTPHFCITPKVHKKDISGWLVKSSIDCHTGKLSRFVNQYLQPHAKALLSYIKNTTDFISKLENVKDTSKDFILVTLDVKSLYTNIPNHEGIETLNNQAKKPIATRVIIKFLYLLLTLNYYVFDGINYFQKKGCAMGTICAPANANIFMGKFEKLQIYLYLRNFSAFYCQFIDDTFLLWYGTEFELAKFIDNLNQKHPTTKFEFTYFKSSITFLDTKVYKNENGKLCTTIYIKPSDRRKFLYYKSTHPKALKDSVQYSQTFCI